LAWWQLIELSVAQSFPPDQRAVVRKLQCLRELEMRDAPSPQRLTMDAKRNSDLNRAATSATELNDTIAKAPSVFGHLLPCCCPGGQ